MPPCSRPSSRQARPVLFITARVHPGETPASHAVHGLLQFLVGATPEAKALRRAAVWVIVPMLNPDGVSAGNYRCDAGALALAHRVLLDRQITIYLVASESESECLSPDVQSSALVCAISPHSELVSLNWC